MNVFHYSSGGAAATRAIEGTPVQFVSGDFAVQASYVRLQVLDADVWVTYDGTTPSASNGERIAQGTSGHFMLSDVLDWKFVRVSGNARVFAQPCNLLSPGSPLA